MSSWTWVLLYELCFVPCNCLVVGMCLVIGLLTLPKSRSYEKLFKRYGGCSCPFNYKYIILLPKSFQLHLFYSSCKFVYVSCLVKSLDRNLWHDLVVMHKLYVIEIQVLKKFNPYTQIQIWMHNGVNTWNLIQNWSFKKGLLKPMLLKIIKNRKTTQH